MTQEETLKFEVASAILEVKFLNEGIYFCNKKDISIEARFDKNIFTNIDNRLTEEVKLNVTTNSVVGLSPRISVKEHNDSVYILSVTDIGNIEK